MEQMIKSYESFIESKLSEKSLPEKERNLLFKLHIETLRNFQHERLIHLLIMLFFIFITICLVFGTMISLFTGLLLPGLFLYLLLALDLIMFVLSVAYVKHYYFLENHIQGLYKYVEKLS